MILWLYLVACGHPETPEVPKASYAERTEWSAVQSPTTVPIVTLPAEAVPAPSSEVQLAPPAAGRLLRWHVSPGDSITAGTPLADLASPQLTALRARVSTLSSRVEQARTQRDLMQASAASGVVSRMDLQAAEASLREAQSELAGTRGELVSYGGQSGAGLTWTSAYDGIVGEIRCPVGPVQDGVSCLTVQRDRQVLLEVRVPARHIAALQGPLRADFVSLDGSHSPFVEVSRAPAMDRHTRSLLVQFRTQDDVMPGAAGRALLSAPRADDLYIIPRSALTRMDGVPSVFVGSADAPETRAVDVLGGDDDTALVRGVDASEQVATRGVFLLKSLMAQEAQ